MIIDFARQQNNVDTIMTDTSDLTDLIIITMEHNVREEAQQDIEEGNGDASGSGNSTEAGSRDSGSRAQQSAVRGPGDGDPEAESFEMELWLFSQS